MAEYLPYTKPGTAVTRTASAAVAGGQIVEVTGSMSVGPAGAGSTRWYGVAAFDAPAGASVTVYRGGEGYILTAGAVAAGDQLGTGAAGTVATAAAAVGTAVVGVAATNAASGAKVLVGFAR